MKISLFLIATAVLKVASTASIGQDHKVFVKSPLQRDSLANVYIEYGAQPVEGTVVLSYGSCGDDIAATHEVARFNVSTQERPEKFVWHVLTEVESGCFFATDATGTTIAQSKPYTVTKKLSKRGYPESSQMHFSALDHYKNRKTQGRPNASSKSKRIGIVGAGISGLFSGYLLEQAGFRNYEILEASDRVGGRIHTVYFDDSEIAYQEMGAMRFPFEFEHEGKSLPVPDQFPFISQIVDELNALNDESHKIEFIEWYQGRPNNLYYKNGFRLPDGRIPTIGEVQGNPSLIPDGPDVSELTKEINNSTKEFLNEEWFKLIGNDLHTAYAKVIDKGYDDWSEMDFIHNKMGASLNASMYFSGTPAKQIWHKMHVTFTFEKVNKWKTIQGGVSRLPRAFEPLLGDKIIHGPHVTKIDHIDGRLSVQWKNSPYDKEYQSKEYDNVIVAVPFSIVRTWKLPQLDFMLNEAIQKLRYSQACKVALSFSERFWEHLDRPIEGGCDETDLLSGTICYPVNNFGSNGTGVVLASYVEDVMSFSFASMTEEQHVGRTLDDFTLLHGDLVDKYYTGNYTRYCWSLDPLAAGHLSKPLPGQNKLYRPTYFNSDHGLVFIGDHTSLKTEWVSGAMESAIRGVVMILVENGHIDEARCIVKKYNISWLEV